MRTLLKTLRIAMICGMFFNSTGVFAKKKVSKAVKSSTNSQLKSDIKFDDHSVNGKYQVPMEALAVVENEKTLDDLIGVRKNFQDRIQNSKELR